ncbi:MAG: ABC transporter substrate-binding protein [Candidatus Reconcilbacillus cellulovorans]|uniref:ABC transporter substrate-binding protein n=1 Tax=Candidatus Reconcilbacillus cellulovorans TaxID=1906605 RepID=A0A2A6E1M1_9BACL|nr:MAG: ABC transporter substrate-binding protein [Candidatus Reconcilbacillus cellulovorans]
MKLDFKRSALLLLASVLALSAAACGKSGDDGKTTTDSGASSPSPSTGAQADNTPITFTFFSSDPSPNWNNMQDEVGKVITEKTGVTLKAEFSTGNEDKVALIAASGNYPDLISPKNGASLLVNAGALLDLTELIEKHAPNLKKVYGPYMKRLRWSNEDPSIYILPTYAGVNHTAFDEGGVFHLQHAVVKELGYPQIRTVKDFENAIRQYKEKHPTIDGQPTIGLSLIADNWRIMISVTNPAFFATGASDDGEYYIDPKTYEAKLHYRRPEEKEYFRWLNHLNAIGLLDPESFVQKEDQYKAKIASGRVLGLIDATWGFADAVNSLKAAGKFERTYGHYPVTLNESFKAANLQDTGFMAGWGVGITKSCKDPVRAIKFLDWLASEEGQILINWGIEGKHYKVENGKRVIPPDVLEKKTNDAANFARTTGIGLYNLLSAHYGDGVKDSTGNYFTTNFPEQIQAGYSPIEKEVLAAYGKTTWKDFFPPASEFPVKPWGAAWNIPVDSDSELNVLFKKTQEIVWKRIPQVILAKPEEFDKLWDEFMKDLIDAGVEKQEKLYTELVKARVKLWNE